MVSNLTDNDDLLSIFIDAQLNDSPVSVGMLTAKV